MITDDRLKALYRESTSRTFDASIDADTLMQALERSGWPDEEGTPLDRVAGSAVHADLLRAVMALEEDARAFSREVAAIRSPGRGRRPSAARGWLALAAGAGAAAVLMLGLFSLPGPDNASPSAASGAILSASFEGATVAADTGAQEAVPIFRGDFDS